MALRRVMRHVRHRRVVIARSVSGHLAVAARAPWTPGHAREAGLDRFGDREGDGGVLPLGRRPATGASLEAIPRRGSRALCPGIFRSVIAVHPSRRRDNAADRRAGGDVEASAGLGSDTERRARIPARAIAAGVSNEPCSNPLRRSRSTPAAIIESSPSQALNSAMSAHSAGKCRNDGRGHLEERVGGGERSGVGNTRCAPPGLIRRCPPRQSGAPDIQQVRLV